MINIDIVKNITPPTYKEFRSLYEKDIKEDYIPEIEVERSWNQFKDKTRISWMADIDGQIITEGWLFNNNDKASDIAYKILTDVSALLEANLNKEKGE